jgi:two-component system, NarL family, nitrate/nitrite response regulator NarL
MVEVIIVSAQPIFEEGLRVIVQDSEFATVVGVCHRLPDLQTAQSLPPGALFLIDYDNSYDLNHLRGLCQWGGHRICLFVPDLAPEFMYQLREAGIAAIISTHRSGQDLISSLRSVADGQFFFDSLLFEQDERSESVRLSPREAQLVELLTRGLKNKEIATQLGITEGTVKVYLSKLFQKVGAKDRFELALSGLKNLGLTPSPGNSHDDSPSAGGPDALRTFVTRTGPARNDRSGRRLAS